MTIVTLLRSVVSDEAPGKRKSPESVWTQGCCCKKGMGFSKRTPGAVQRTRMRWPGRRLLERRSFRLLIRWMEAPYWRAMPQRVSPCRTVW